MHNNQDNECMLSAQCTCMLHMQLVTIPIHSYSFPILQAAHNIALSHPKCICDQVACAMLTSSS